MKRKKNKFAGSDLLSFSSAELAQLDEASKHAEEEIKSMIEALDSNAEGQRAFIAEITKLRPGDSTQRRSGFDELSPNGACGGRSFDTSGRTVKGDD